MSSSVEQTTQYNNPKPVVVNIVHIARDDDSRGLLGIIRGIEPAKGGLAFPGGYVDELESIEEAAAREFQEEIGLATSPADWRLLHSATTPANRVLIFCELKVTLNANYISKLQPNEEVEGFVILDSDSQLAFPLHQKALHKYLVKPRLCDFRASGGQQ